MYGRLAQDVDLDEEAELHRLEGGAVDGPVLLCEAAAVLDVQGGVVRLYMSHLEWEPGASSSAAVHLPIARVASFQQSKAGKPQAKLKVTSSDGAAYVFDFLVPPADLAGATARRDLLHDALKAQMDAIRGT